VQIVFVTQLFAVILMKQPIERLYYAVQDVVTAPVKKTGGKDKSAGKDKPSAEVIDLAASKTAKLIARGRSKMAQKLGEEAVEVVIAAVAEDRHAVVLESADLLYHLVVLWHEVGVAPEDVWQEMARRERVKGLAEKI
jgi:phosphoribosyl-ATP pyrophosphohydrolase